MSAVSAMEYQPASINGFTIVVTGAAGGIGKATSIFLASAGAKVGLLDFADPTSVAEEINQKYGPGKAVAVSCDVTSSESVEKAIAKIVEELGPLDGAANLAGVIGRGRKVGTTEGQLMGTSNLIDLNHLEQVLIITDMTDAEWDRVMNVNILGVKNCMRAELNHFNQKGGAIVNAASVAGQEALPFNSAYGASKAAVISLTKSVAKEVSRLNIRVNAIAPGVVDTSLMAAIADRDTLLKFANRASMQRPAQPIEIARLIFWLLSDHNTFATAGIFNIDGGW